MMRHDDDLTHSQTPRTKQGITRKSTDDSPIIIFNVTSCRTPACRGETEAIRFTSRVGADVAVTKESSCPVSGQIGG